MSEPVNESTQQAEAICALATPAGRGALSIVRASGEGVIAVAETITKKKLKPRQATYSSLFDKQDQVIDQGIVICFTAPASFTGEDVVEYHCHGNPLVSDLLLQTLCKHGARVATAGEFSQRAYLNNKIDLTQAEAIVDLINSTTEQGLRNATKSLQGAFSDSVHQILAELIQIRTYIEAYLDFPDDEPEEKIDTQQITAIKNKTQLLLENIGHLQQQAKRGERLHSGATIAIAGRPNAGKSSLLNCLAQSEVAIVTEIPGTTRDALSADIDIHGIPVRLIDTAGMRETKDVVEQKGIQRAQQATAEADLVLWLSDITDTQGSVIPASVDFEPNKVISVQNKIDLIDAESFLKRKSEKGTANTQVYISASNADGIEELIDCIAAYLGSEEQGDTPFSARRRHLIALQQASENIRMALGLLTASENLELVAEELRLAQLSLGEITGEFSSDDLLGKIFSEFCIGK